MSFFDALGDTFDIFKDAGEQSLGIVMDYTKAATDYNHPFSASRRLTSQTAHRFSQYGDDHRRVATVAHKVASLAEGSLEALAYPAHLEQRAFSTAIQAGALGAVAPGLSLTQRESHPTLKQAWQNSAKVSTAQSAAVALGVAPEGANFKNAWQYGDRESDKFNSKFSWITGSFDAIVALADPLIVGGKAVKLVNLSRKTIKAGDVAALAEGATTARGARTVKKFNSILDATEGKSPNEIYTLFKRHGATNSAGLASVLAQAPDRTTRSLILRHSMGDTSATEVLTAQRREIMDQIDRMNADLDDLFDAADTGVYSGIFDIDRIDTETARAALAAQRDESERVLDTHNRILGSGLRGDEDQAGLFDTMQQRFKAGRLDNHWMKGASAYYLQPGVGGVVKRIVSSGSNMRPAGYIPFHDADAGVNEIQSLTRRVPSLTRDQRTDMLNRYIAAPDDNARRQAMEGIENEIYQTLGRHYGYEDQDIKALVQRIAHERDQHRFKSGNGRLYGFTGKDKVAKDTLLETQLENGHFTMPIDLTKKILQRNIGRYKTLKNASGKTFDFLDAMGDFVNDLWKFEALFRGGYPLRNLADNQLRMISYLGAHQYAMIQAANTKNAALRGAARTAQMGGKEADLPVLGMGTRDLGEYKDLADAMGTTRDQAAQVLADITGAQNVSNQMADRYNSLLNHLRSGNWKPIDGTDPEYVDHYLRVVNGQFRNSEIATRLLRGDSPDRVIKWLRSAEARPIRRRLMHGGDSAEALVLNNIENLNHVLPQEMWAEAAARPFTPDDVARMFAKAEDRPPIHAEQIAATMGQGHVAEVWNQITSTYFQAVGSLTDDAMGRHPLFVQLYRGKQSELLKRSDPTLSGVLEPELQRSIEVQARKWARREMKNIMFDVAQKSDLAHFVRFIMPFYSAWGDAMKKYSRIIVRDPSRLGYLQQFWTAPNDSSLVEVVDEDGNPVPGSKSRLSDNEYVRIPAGWAKKLGLNWSPAISKSSFNIALQGDPIWAPGWGPMGTIPINQFIRKSENPQLAHVAEALGILPFGVQDYGKLGLKGFYSGALRQQAQSEARWARLKAQVLVDATYEARKEGKPDPTWADVEGRFKAIRDLRFFTSALSPVSIQYQSPHQLYIDQSHAYDQMVGKPGGFDSFEEADAAYLKKFGKDAYIFRTSLSKSNVPIRPSVRADRAALKVKDLIDKHPKFAPLFIGPNNTGEYDRNVYALQSSRKIGGSSDTWRDTYSDPEEGLRRNRVEEGWIEYQKISTRLNVALENAGLTSMNQAKAARLRQIKHDWIESVAGPDGPNWGQDWYRDYQSFGSSAVTDFLGAAKEAVGDKRIAGRADIRALGIYLTARTQVRTLLQQRYHNGGSASIAAKSNEDLSGVWAALTSSLVKSNLTFEDYFNRYLERDDLSKVVK